MSGPCVKCGGSETVARPLSKALKSLMTGHKNAKHQMSLSEIV